MTTVKMAILNDLAYQSAMTEFAAAVRAWRKRLGLNQAEAAASIGVNQKTIRNYEKGATIPGLAERLAMAAVEAKLPPIEDERPPSRRFVVDFAADPPTLIHLAEERDQSE